MREQSHSPVHPKRSLILLVGVLALTSPSCAPAKKQAVQVLVKVHSEMLFVGERLKVTVAITNKGEKAIRILRMPFLVSASHSTIELKGEKTGQVRSTTKWKPLSEPSPDDYHQLVPDETSKLDIDLEEELDLSPKAADVYWLAVALQVDGQMVPAPIVKFEVRELPPLQLASSFDAIVRAQSGNYTQRLEIGLLTAEKERSLVASFRHTEVSKKAFVGTPRVLRLGTATVDARIDDIQFNDPIDGAISDQRLAFHVLVSEPNGTQRYFIFTPYGHLTYEEVFKDKRRRVLVKDAEGFVELKKQP